MEKKTDFRSLSTKAKIDYVWDYYRWPFIIIGAVIIVVATFAYEFASYEAPLLNVVMINCNKAVDTTAEGYYDFLDEISHPHSDSAVSLTSTLNFDENNLSTTMYDRQTLTTLLYAGDTDLFLGTGDVYLQYVSQGVLSDLTKLLTPETLKAYEDSLLYCTDEETNETYPCAIELKDNKWVKKYNYYDSCYFGIPWRAPNTELATEFAEYLLNYENKTD